MASNHLSNLITVRNTQRTIPINVSCVAQWAVQILKLVKFEDFQVNIWITTNETIRRYNARYRDKDKATDILSFPFFTLVPGEHPSAQKGSFLTEEERILGDIIISAPRVLKDATELGTTVDERLKVLLVHGICHLIGYDHKTDAQYAAMHRKEMSILSKIK